MVMNDINCGISKNLSGVVTYTVLSYQHITPEIIATSVVMVKVVLTASPESSVGLEPAVERCILLFIESQVPLPYCMCRVSQISEVLREQFILQIQPPGLTTVKHILLHTCVYGVHP